MRGLMRRLVRRWRGDVRPLQLAKLFAPAVPLNIRLDPGLASRPRLNVLLPGLAMHCLSGGPNTALNLAYRMAAHGVPVRYVATDLPADRDQRPLVRHMMRLAGIDTRFEHVEIVTGHDRRVPLALGENDVFLATAWWTAQMVKAALPRMRCKRFLYLVQDFEPGLHAFSSHYALAYETYGLDYYAIVNHRLLYDYMVANSVGRFGEPQFAARCAVLDPAIDRAHFYPGERSASAPRTLLFYARATAAERNLFELGVAALNAAAERGVFDHGDWRLYGIGEQFFPIKLAGGHTLRPLPWLEYEEYARWMRSADVLLSLMLSPHPSYPPLEMAAAGGLVVTNTFGTKSAARLAEIAPAIIAAAPSVEAIAEAIGQAAARTRQLPAAALHAPATWDESFAPVIPFAMRAWRECTAA
jgi:O-antigen biosynthesis protein